jgi:diguanylate cyclase (GGDEF)-like protein/PAS domain S-box-containing protein
VTSRRIIGAERATTASPLARAIPFAVCATAGVVTLAFPPYHHQAAHLAVSAVLGLACFVMATRPRPSILALAAAPVFFVLIAVLRDGNGGSASGLSPLVALPVLWVALYGSRVEMFVAAASTGLVFTAPLLLVDGPRYDVTDWRRAALWVLIAAVVGPVVQGVVRRLEEREREARAARAYADGVLTAATEHSIIATDLDGLITTFNAGAERMLGYEAGEMIGRQTPAILHDPEEVRARATELGVEPGFDVFVHAARRGETETREWTYVTKDGSRIPVRLSVSPLRDEGGHLSGFMGLARDVSGWKTALAAAERAEARWRVLLDHLPDTSVLTVDRDLRFRVAMGAGLDQQGLADIAGKTLHEVSGEDNARLMEPIYRAALEGKVARADVQATHTGRVHEVFAVPLPSGPDGDEALIVARDVSEARRREQLLAEAKEKFTALFEEAPFCVMVIGLDGLVTDVNPAVCRVLGYTRDELIGQPATLAGEDPVRLDGLLSELRDSRNARRAGESRVRHRDGHLVDLAFEAIVLHDSDGVPASLLVNAVDISDRRRFEAQLAHLAEHDPLTGLANRRRFDRDLERHLDRCRRYGARGALVMLDLDHFKEVNDTLGHGAGDQLIVSVATLLQGRMRTSDTVARLGGDEFVVLLPEADGIAAEQVALDIVDLVRDQAAFADGSRPQRVGASVGVVVLDGVGLTASELLSTADMTMYDAKESGRGRHAVVFAGSSAGRVFGDRRLLETPPPGTQR